ncbi:hypothetical protein ACR77J_07285 [Tissierella praeacuta]|uniref:hypothetical protein n=1 Tax=Tissierella praeacuta TaxID=43131 RepID=UPI003DA29ACE
MKIGDVVYAIVVYDICTYSTETVRIKEEINDHMFRVQSISGVGSFGVFKDLLFRTEEEADRKISEMSNKEETKLRKSITSKEDLVKHMYSHIEPGLKRRVIKEKIKELLDISIS